MIAGHALCFLSLVCVRRNQLQGNAFHRVSGLVLWPQSQLCLDFRRTDVWSRASVRIWNFSCMCSGWQGTEMTLNFHAFQLAAWVFVSSRPELVLQMHGGLNPQKRCSRHPLAPRFFCSLSSWSTRFLTTANLTGWRLLVLPSRILHPNEDLKSDACAGLHIAGDIFCGFLDLLLRRPQPQSKLPTEYLCP